MRVPGRTGVLCALFLLLAGALGGREVGRQRKDFSAPARGVLNRIKRSCSKDMTVTPSEDVLSWRVGEVQEVWCSLAQTHDPALSSANLTIMKDGVPLPHQTVNETTIQVTLNLTRPESYKLICSDDAKTQMCMSQVYVGYEPLEVEDLQCVSHNWESFSCNWTMPYNPVQSTNKDYVPYLMSPDDPSSKSLCSCSDYDNLLGDSCDCPDTCCLWGREDYFPASPQVVVMFVAENDLGSTIFNYTIDNYAVVLPDPMKEVTAAAAAERLEAEVGWTLPVPMTVFAAYAGGVLVRVDHRLTDDGAGGAGAWVQGEVVECRSNSCTTDQQVVPLEHWWRQYEFRVRLRSAAAPQPVEGDGWWSGWQPRYANTSAAAPDAPPGVGPGTFQVETAGFAGLSDLSLAWRAVPPLLHNGSDFHYLAQLCGADGDAELRCEVLKEVAVTESFAVFQNVSSSAPYTLRVAAHNSAGGGPWAAVWVAAAAQRPAPPLLPVVVQHGGAGRQDALYELRWAPGGEGNHTVYLCTGEHQSARPCTGQLYWTSVGNTSAVNVTLRDFGVLDASPAKVSFAVSAEDTAGASSGFSWDLCGAPQPYTGVRAPPEPGVLATSSSSVELPWTLSCSFWAGVVEEAEATCCRGTHASPENCTETRVSATGQPWAGAVVVAGLAAGEEYTAWLRLRYRGGASAWADGRTFTTNTAGAEAWLIVVVAGVVVLASVILVFGLVYGKRKFVDNLKKLRVKPSLPSGLVPTVSPTHTHTHTDTHTDTHTHTHTHTHPGGYVGVAGPGDSGGGRGRGGSQSPPTGAWSGSSGGSSGYVPPSACTKLPLSATPTSGGYVTAQHGEHVATGSPGYVQTDVVPHPLPIPEGQSGYVSADFPMMVTDAAPPGTTHDSTMTTTHPATSTHDPDDSIPFSAFLRGEMNGCEAGKHTEKPSYVSMPDMSWMGDNQTSPSADKPDSEGSESCEKPNYVFLPDLSWMGDKQTSPSSDVLDTRGSDSQKIPPRTASNAPAVGYIAVQPPDFGNHTQKAETEERTGSQDTEPTGLSHSPVPLPSLLSKPSNALHPSPVHIPTPVFPVSTHNAPGAPCKALKPDIPHWEGGINEGGYVPLPVTRADDTSEKENSSRENSWFNSLISPLRASMTSEEPLTGTSLVVLGDNPSRDSSVNGGTDIEEMNVDSHGVEVHERERERERDGEQNEREENDRLTIDGLPKGYSRVGNPPE